MQVANRESFAKATRLPHEVLQYVEFVSCGLQVRADTTYVPTSSAGAEIRCGFALVDGKGVGYTGPFASDSINDSTEVTRILWNGTSATSLVACWRNTPSTGRVLSIGGYVGQYVEARFGSSRSFAANGTSATLNAPSGTTSAPPSVKLVCGYPSSVASGVVWRIYHFQALTAGVVTHDIRPVRMRSTGAVRFYDTARDRYLELSIGGYDIPAQCISGVGALPSGVVPIQWLGSDGQAVIDTDVLHTNVSRVDLGFLYSQWAQYGNVFYSSYSASGQRWTRVILASSDNNGGYVNFLSSNAITPAGKFTKNVKHFVRMTAAGATIDGTPYTAPAQSGTSYSAKIVIFSSGSPGYLRDIGCRIYHFRMWDNSNALIRDYVPVRVGGTGYLYDMVSGRLFAEPRGRTFRLGPDVN